MEHCCFSNQSHTKLASRPVALSDWCGKELEAYFCASVTQKESTKGGRVEEGGEPGYSQGSTRGWVNLKDEWGLNRSILRGDKAVLIQNNLEQWAGEHSIMKST